MFFIKKLGIVNNMINGFYIKIEIIYLNNKMPCTQNRIYCDVCHISVLPDNYQNHIRSQGHASNVLKKSCTNSMIIKTHNKKR